MKLNKERIYDIFKKEADKFIEFLLDENEHCRNCQFNSTEYLGCDLLATTGQDFKEDMCKVQFFENDTVETDKDTYSLNHDDAKLEKLYDLGCEIQGSYKSSMMKSFVINKCNDTSFLDKLHNCCSEPNAYTYSVSKDQKQLSTRDIDELLNTQQKQP